MRKNLEKINGDRLQFTATVARFGTKTNYHGFAQKTICFKDVNFICGKVATDHLWMTVGKTIESLNLNEGDKVTFFARVGGYRKGYYKDEFDYTLRNISKLSLI